MEMSGYFMVTVKVDADEVNDVKKHKEKYLVKRATAAEAAKCAEAEMSGCTSTWKIDSVKEVKIDAILS